MEPKLDERDAEDGLGRNNKTITGEATRQCQWKDRKTRVKDAVKSPQVGGIARVSRSRHRPFSRP